MSLRSCDPSCAAATRRPRAAGAPHPSSNCHTFCRKRRGSGPVPDRRSAPPLRSAGPQGKADGSGRGSIHAAASRQSPRSAAPRKAASGCRPAISNRTRRSPPENPGRHEPRRREPRAPPRQPHRRIRPASPPGTPAADPDLAAGAAKSLTPSQRTPRSGGRTLSQVATGDLDIAVFGQLALTDLTLGDAFEACSLQVIGLDAPLRGRPLRQQALKGAPRDADNPCVLPNPDAELDRLALGIPSDIIQKGKERHSDSASITFLYCSHNALPYARSGGWEASHRCIMARDLSVIAGISCDSGSDK